MASASPLNSGNTTKQQGQTDKSHLGDPALESWTPDCYGHNPPSGYICGFTNRHPTGHGSSFRIAAGPPSQSTTPERTTSRTRTKARMRSHNMHAWRTDWEELDRNYGHSHDYDYDYDQNHDHDHDHDHGHGHGHGHDYKDTHSVHEEGGPLSPQRGGRGGGEQVGRMLPPWSDDWRPTEAGGCALRVTPVQEPPSGWAGGKRKYVDLDAPGTERAIVERQNKRLMMTHRGRRGRAYAWTAGPGGC